MDVLYPKGHAKKIPHRHFVFSIPKIIRRYFLYDRKLLADLSRCAWGSLKGFLYPEGHKQDAVPENEPIPGAVIAMQTFGDFLGFNPHCHILVTDGCFSIRPRIKRQGLSSLEMAGSHVFAYPEPGRADGEILWILQSRVSRDRKGKTAKGRQR